MIGICRRAVDADRWLARGIGGGVEAVVTRLAQTAQSAELKRHEVALMPLDVVSDRRRYDVTALKAQRAKRLGPELVPSAACPTCGAIPAVNLRTGRH